MDGEDPLPGTTPITLGGHALTGATSRRQSGECDVSLPTPRNRVSLDDPVMITCAISSALAGRDRCRATLGVAARPAATGSSEVMPA
jgi:hypothetical protein